MVAHGRILKKEYGDDYHIVFVGPCIAKKKEASEHAEIDYALTFEEINQMFIDDNIKFIDVKESDTFSSHARFYPVTRGIIKSFKRRLSDKFDYIAIDSDKEIKDALSNIESLSNLFIEMNMCEGACINGPAKVSTRSTMLDESIVRKYARTLQTSYEIENMDIDLSTKHLPRPIQEKIPTEVEIKEILSKIFKYNKEDEINCGACGYATCREKAIAVFNGLADPEFCMPY